MSVTRRGGNGAAAQEYIMRKMRKRSYLTSMRIETMSKLSKLLDSDQSMGNIDDQQEIWTISGDGWSVKE